MPLLCPRPTAPPALTDGACPERLPQAGSRRGASPRRGVDRPTLEACWLDLTRRVLPSLAAERRWPVRADHCFQRILLDAATGGVWYDAIIGRPAYAHAADDILSDAIALGEGAVAGRVDLVALNKRSLAARAARQ